MNMFTRIITSFVTVGIVLAPTIAHAAGSASITLAANKSQVEAGSTVTISAYEGGTDVTYAKVRLSYDASKLSCSAANVSGGVAFPNAMTADIACGGGVAVMSYYVNGGTTAPAGSLVGNVTFTALANTGAASIATMSGSQLAVNGANVWNGATTSAMVQIVAAPVDPGMGSGSNTGATNTPAAPSATTTPTSSASHNISASTPVSTTTATTSQTASQPATSGAVKQANTNKAVTASIPSKQTVHKQSWLPFILGLIALLGVVYLLRNSIRKLIAAAPVTAATGKPVAQKKKPVAKKNRK